MRASVFKSLVAVSCDVGSVLSFLLLFLPLIVGRYIVVGVHLLLRVVFPLNIFPISAQAVERKVCIVVV